MTTHQKGFKRCGIVARHGLESARGGSGTLTSFSELVESPNNRFSSSATPYKVGAAQSATALYPTGRSAAIEIFRWGVRYTISREIWTLTTAQARMLVVKCPAQPAYGYSFISTSSGC